MERLHMVMTREELAGVFCGCGAELGVAAGSYSACILCNPAVTRLYSIDRWSDHHDAAEMRRACESLSAFGDRSVVLRSTFTDAVAQFADGSLDFVYVDGYAHTGQDGGRTLRDWWPKLRVGGIFAGHDYCETYRPTVEAVDKFCQEHELPLHVTSEELPSWVTVKV